jgi:hypothetical protein
MHIDAVAHCTEPVEHLVPFFCRANANHAQKTTTLGPDRDVQVFLRQSQMHQRRRRTIFRLIESNQRQQNRS